MNPFSGATMVGAVGLYRFKQLASSPGRTRKRVKPTRSKAEDETISASRPAGSSGSWTSGSSEVATSAYPPVPDARSPAPTGEPYQDAGRPQGQAQAVVLDWCYGFYNHDRWHSTIGMVSPITYENTAAPDREAA